MSRGLAPKAGWLGAVLTSLSIACASRPAATAPVSEVSLVFTTALSGSIEPCGCSQAMRGGLARVLGVVDTLRATGRAVHYFDAGDLLFAPGPISPEALPQQRLKAQTLARALSRAGLEARLAGPSDAREGAQFLAEQALPALPPSNHERPYRTVSVGTSTVAIVGASTLVDARRAAAKARADGAAFVVALVLQPFETLLGQLSQDEAEPLDLVVAAQPKDELSAELNRALGTRPRLVQAQSKGRSLLRVDLRLSGGARPVWVADDAARQRELSALDERIEQLRAQVNEPGLADDFKALKQGKLDEVVARRQVLAQAPLTLPAGPSAVAQLVPVEATRPEQPAIKALVTEYDRAVGELNLSWAKAHGQDCRPPAPEERGFVGSATCEACHPLAVQAWRKTKHARAYAALTEAGKGFHLDCVSCHVTGWQQPGGVCHVADTDGFEHVGCEACHGGASLHVTTMKKTDIDRAATSERCVSCHDRENSAHFEHTRYVAQLLVPGHGLPPEPPPAEPPAVVTPP